MKHLFVNMTLAALTCAPILLGAAVLVASSQPVQAAPQARTTSFEAFDKRARAGERLNVVFFGASLTWGANASDPIRTSYRANIAKKLEAKYPAAHFKFHDGAIGGTNSRLGVFRLQRDAIRHKPDLLFLDFSANDDVYQDDRDTLSSYESLVRRVVTEAKCPIVQVIFPFEWNIKAGEMAKMKRRDAHRAIASAYGVPVGDAIEYITNRVDSGAVGIKTIWPLDGAHPGDKGYELFAEAAWNGLQGGIANKATPKAPSKMLYDPTYMTWSRTRISSLGELPKGWSIGIPKRTSAFFDFLMSRWLDDEAIASNRLETVGANGKKRSTPQEVERLKVNFRGQSLTLLGEATQQSGKYRVYIDGKLIERQDGSKTVADYEPANFAKAIGGNGHHAQLIANDLDPNVEHLLEIEPIFSDDTAQELRLESICVAGGAATVGQIIK
jgi:lysophospholipase L1-like esterase